jgi:hypothetical protein
MIRCRMRNRNHCQVVEVFLNCPVKLHVRFSTHGPTQMLLPVTGQYPEAKVVFVNNGSVPFLSNCIEHK